MELVHEFSESSQLSGPAECRFELTPRPHRIKLQCTKGCANQTALSRSHSHTNGTQDRQDSRRSAFRSRRRARAAQHLEYVEIDLRICGKPRSTKWGAGQWPRTPRACGYPETGSVAVLPSSKVSAAVKNDRDKNLLASRDLRWRHAWSIARPPRSASLP